MNAILINAAATEECDLLLPSGEQRRANEPSLKRVLKFHHGFGFALGLLLGSGLLVSPGLVAAKSASMFLALVAWLVGGLIAALGASCYCELASLFNVTGSALVYVTKIYGPVAGFVWSCTTLFIVSPLAKSIVMTSAGIYVTRMFLSDESSELFVWSSRLIGLLLLAILSIANCLSVKAFGRAQVIFAACKIAVVILFISLGVYQLIRQGKFENIQPPVLFNNSMMLFTWKGAQRFGSAIYTSLWAYGGWDYIPFLIEEMENPSRSIPLVTFTSIPFVAVVFILANLAFMTALTKEEMGKSLSVGITFSEKVSENNLTFLMPLLAVALCFGSINSSIYVNSRVYITAAREKLLPSVFSWIHRKRRTPILGVISSFLVTLPWLLIVKDLQSCISYFSVCVWIVKLSVFVGVIVLRRSQPDAVRTFKVCTPIPVIMAIVASTIIIAGFAAEPIGAAVTVGLILCSLPVYYVCIYKKLLHSFYSDRIEPNVNKVMNHFDMVPSSVDEPILEIE